MSHFTRLSGVAAVVALLAVPASADAWGYEAHKMIMDRAIALLPDALRPLFEKNRAVVVERSIDPDLWRTAGFDSEDPHHFLNIDWEGYGKYPFAGLPRDYTAAIAKFGKERVEEKGTLPWRVEEYFGNLRRAFEAYARVGPFGSVNILFFSASLAHYVSDAHQPFHAVENYDGQFTNQRGIHVRYEATLIERYRKQLTLSPKPHEPIRNPRDFIFDVVREGSQLVPSILAADANAIGTRDVYDDAYYAAFFRDTRDVTARRLNESIAAVAAMITGAWQAAGSPAVPFNPPEPVQRRRRP